MKKPNNIDLHKLEEGARRSYDHEAFRVVKGIQNCRIGVGSRLASSGGFAFFIEVLVNLCEEHHPLDLDSMESYLLALRQLKNRGYSLSCEGNGCISCEFVAETSSVVKEYKAASAIVEICQPRRNENGQARTTER